jgi:hypothetical protein
MGYYYGVGNAYEVVFGGFGKLVDLVKKIPQG